MHEQISNSRVLTLRFVERYRRWMPLILLTVALGLAALAVFLRSYVSPLKLAGYPGVFLLNLLGAVSMVLPVPGLISVCGLSSVLDPFVLGALAGAGESLGEWSGYAVGYGGDTIFERFGYYRRLRPRVQGWMEKRGTLVLFLASIIPNPFFDLVGIAAGSVHFPFRRFMVIIIAGKVLKGLMVAYTCHFGVTALPWVS